MIVLLAMLYIEVPGGTRNFTIILIALVGLYLVAKISLDAGDIALNVQRYDKYKSETEAQIAALQQVIDQSTPKEKPS